MSASSYMILKELGAIIIWCSKGFSGDYASCRKTKYTIEIDLGFIILIGVVVLILKL